MESFILSWHCDGRAWPRVLQGGGGRQEAFVVDLCVPGRAEGLPPWWGPHQLLQSLLLSRGKPSLSVFSPISPLLMPLQVPAAPRPPHLAGRETRFVSALGVRCRCCSRCPLRCPTSPRGLGSPGAPPGLAGGAAPRWHPRHEGLLPVSCCCDGTRQGFGEELWGDGFARARGRVEGGDMPRDCDPGPGPGDVPRGQDCPRFGVRVWRCAESCEGLLS